MQLRYVTGTIVVATLTTLLPFGGAQAHRATPPAPRTCVSGLTKPAGEPGSYPFVSCLDKTWYCKGPQKHTQVNVTISQGVRLDAVHLDSGCTGSLRLTIHTGGEDGVKIHNGAHDLQVWGGPPRPGVAAIICSAKLAGAHQDGLQATSGLRVTLKWMKVWCPTGNNGGLFINQGIHDPVTPTDIVCEHCDLFEGNTAINIGPHSIRSGARWSKLHDKASGASPKNCRRVSTDAVDPIDDENTCLTPR
jgi:hypothetical protein